jgi:hypothetical protein
MPFRKECRVGRYCLLAIVAVTAAWSSSDVHANSTFVANVTDVGTYGDGSIYIFLNTNLSEPGCTANGRIDIAAGHQHLKEILAIAMSARLSGQRVAGAVNGCDPTICNATIDISKNSYINLTD